MAAKMQALPSLGRTKHRRRPLIRKTEKVDRKNSPGGEFFRLTFYICSSSNYTHEHGATFVIAELIDRLSNAGFRYVDFGPSASDHKFSKGVSFFKEGLGAAGQCRDRWLWEAK
jgi:hypothetical protein